MPDSFEPYRRAARHVGPIVFRHVFVLVNAIIFLVAVLLYAFGDHQAAIFLAIILGINTLIGIIQDVQAMVALERLQLLTASRIERIRQDGTREVVLPEKLEKGDRIAVVRGDQIPCDGTVAVSRALEVSEALITGESDVFTKEEGTSVLAGGIVTSGSAEIIVEAPFRDSRIAHMAEHLKTYRATQSPIQQSIERIITYSGILLVGVIIFVVARGFVLDESAIAVVRQIGALASTIVPQGLIVVTTLLFAFGAASYSGQHVLFQEINAAEKLGRIKNLCMDKTGTLTNNELHVKQMIVKEGKDEEATKQLVAAYILGSGDSSQTIAAVDAFLTTAAESQMIVEALPFSSWRQYGAVHARIGETDTRVLVGAPDIFLPFVTDPEEHSWLEAKLIEFAESGNRILSIAEVKGEELPRALVGSSLSIAALFVFESGLREGINEAIAFFQDRGVKIRILSGDNPATVRAVARLAGVRDVDAVITGAEMKEWSDEDYRTKTASYRIFARVLPEQKVKIVDALRRDGFTAMVGDGANDALAIRRSDLGIAMFDGAQATRQLAAVVLMNNSFTALPGAVRLADSFIQHLEIFSGIFLYQSVIGFFFFLFVSVFGYSFPFTPLNITPINYFAVGLPGMLIGYWALRSGENAPPAGTGDFISRVSLFPALSALGAALGAAVVFLETLGGARTPASSTLFALLFIASGVAFFAVAPGVYQKRMTRRERTQMGMLFGVELALLALALQSAFLKHLFEIQPFPSAHQLVIAVGAIVLLVPTQYLFARWFTRDRRSGEVPILG